MADLSEDELAEALRVLDKIVHDRGLLAAHPDEARAQLMKLAGEIARPDTEARRSFVRARRRLRRDERRARDEARRQETGIRAKRAEPVFVTPDATRAIPSSTQAEAGRLRGDDELEEARMCYVCKASYRRLHRFYDQLCPACGDRNEDKRTPRVDLTGRVALVTGSRVKIGYQAAIMLLRNGCHVVVSTRFPRDAAERYAREADFEEWSDRLDIVGLDLRHTPSVERAARALDERLPRLDFIIHNACQTVRRPPDFYAHLMESERAPLAMLPAAVRGSVERWEELRDDHQDVEGLADPAALSQVASVADRLLADGSETGLQLFPAGALDADLQQVDLRTHNSWRLTLEEVPTFELLEVLLVNAVAPFVLSSRLKSLMTRSEERDKHIVNVSAMEGQFYRNKTDKHPHTNMAKAALNMLTRTSAQGYRKDGIHMNAVDTGWVTDEDPAHLAARKVEEHGFSPPLDIVDGAARIIDPIVVGLSTGEHPWGVFFKDYEPAQW
jgi:NAD(P)-dependent dehydrogenase (short-subunit alcohol dehydrogenase family)